VALHVSWMECEDICRDWRCEVNDRSTRDFEIAHSDSQIAHEFTRDRDNRGLRAASQRNRMTHRV